MAYIEKIYERTVLKRYKNVKTDIQTFEVQNEEPKIVEMS